MKANIKGFTIVEVMLFLAITGLMIAGILASTGSTLNMQRYRDSVDSLQAYLQDQYSQVLNVRNDNVTPPDSCFSTSTTVRNRAQSKCVLMGRYITTSNSGKQLTSYPVYGSRGSGSTGSSDFSEIQQYSFTKISAASGVSDDKYDIEWQSTMYSKAIAPASPVIAQFTIFVVRSPISGNVLTFMKNSENAPLTNASDGLIQASALSQTLNICVVSSLPVSNSGKMGITMLANSSSSNGVKAIGDASGVCP